MAHRLAALFLTILFTGHTLAGAVGCVAGDHRQAEEMACCVQSDSVAGSVIAKLCCQLRCGKPINDGQSTPQELTQLQTPLLSVSHYPASDYCAAANAVLVRSAEARLLERHPPPLFLSHSSLLI
jgi:hypothetical protein